MIENFHRIFQSRGVACFSLSKNLCSLAFPFRAGFACFVTDCRLSFVFLVFAFDIPLLSPSGRVARSAERGQIKILPYIEASPCLIVLAHNEAKMVSLFHRLPLGGRLCRGSGGGEGRSPFLIEIFHRKFSIKGQLHFRFKNFSNEGEVPSPKSRSVNAPPYFPLFRFFSWGRKARKNLR